MTTQQRHFGDPCIHCAMPHDDVPAGPCLGEPANAKIIGYASLGARWDGVEHYRYRLSTGAVEDVHSHVSSHAPYYHFGRQVFGQPPPYDARLKSFAPTESGPSGAQRSELSTLPGIAPKSNSGADQ